MSPILDPSHDLAHPVETDSAWSESYYFNCYDPVTDCGFFTRVGVRPLEGTIDVGLSVWVPDGGLARTGHVRPQHEMIDTDLDVGPARYRMIEAGRRWLLEADGDTKAGHLKMRVEFEALTPLIGADGQGGTGAGATEQTRQMVGKGHLEQAGRWSGTVVIGDREILLSETARGNRDKSWGPRRWGAPRMWRWFSVNIDDDTHFGGIRIGTDSGDLHRGWAWVGGTVHSITAWDLETEVEDDGVTHRANRVWATDKEGGRHELQGEMLRVDPGTRGIRPDSTIVNEGLARWTYQGRVGHGISEYLHQLDHDGRPVVAIE